jgi:single-strand DNA-binding protein
MAKKSLNDCQFIGNLTRDPELRYTPSGSAVVDYGVAVNRSYKVNDEWKEEVTYLNVQAWGDLAERVAKNYRKGDRTFIKAEFRLDSWEDKNTGEKKSSPKFRLVNEWHLGEPAKNGSIPTYHASEKVVESEDVEDTEDIPF